MFNKAIQADIARFFSEDDLSRNAKYIQSLPMDEVNCSLKLKDDLTLSGLAYLVEAFNFLGADLNYNDFKEYEGMSVLKSDIKEISFKLPFAIALTGERIALNLLSHASSISTYTKKFVELASKKNVQILDTRKTTPGLRALEKYAVTIGGGYNHRLGQTDMWMIKDNHKSFFGGVKEAIDFFKSQQAFYTPIELEIHSLSELKEGIELGINHFMLDNFEPAQIKEAVAIKPAKVTYEVSGGVNLENIEGYLIEGVDAISIGRITYAAPSVDISLKYERA